MILSIIIIQLETVSNENWIHLFHQNKIRVIDKLDCFKLHRERFYESNNNARPFLFWPWPLGPLVSVLIGDDSPNSWCLKQSWMHELKLINFYIEKYFVLKKIINNFKSRFISIESNFKTVIFANFFQRKLITFSVNQTFRNSHVSQCSWIEHCIK